MTKNDTEPSEGTVRRAVLESDPKDNTDLAKVLSEEAGKAKLSRGQTYHLSGRRSQSGMATADRHEYHT